MQVMLVVKSLIFFLKVNHLRSLVSAIVSVEFFFFGYFHDHTVTDLLLLHLIGVGF